MSRKHDSEHLRMEIIRLRLENKKALKACSLAEDYLVRQGHQVNDGTRSGMALEAIQEVLNA